MRRNVMFTGDVGILGFGEEQILTNFPKYVQANPIPMEDIDAEIETYRELQQKGNIRC